MLRGDICCMVVGAADDAAGSLFERRCGCAFRGVGGTEDPADDSDGVVDGGFGCIVGGGLGCCGFGGGLGCCGFDSGRNSDLHSNESSSASWLGYRFLCSMSVEKFEVASDIPSTDDDSSLDACCICGVLFAESCCSDCSCGDGEVNGSTDGAASDEGIVIRSCSKPGGFCGYVAVAFCGDVTFSVCSLSSLCGGEFATTVSCGEFDLGISDGGKARGGGGVGVRRGRKAGISIRCDFIFAG